MDTDITSASSPSPPFPCLKVPRPQAEDKIAAQIQGGRELLGLLMDPNSDLALVRRQHDKWSRKNEIMLRGLLDPPHEALAQYKDVSPSATPSAPTHKSSIPPSPYQMQRAINNVVQRQIDVLDLIRESLQYCAQPAPSRDTRPTKAALAARDVFVVHGHDEEAKQVVARFLEHLEQGGRTVQERC
jgi:hypothetical protein